ncbi:MAG: cytochrome c [Acidobacteriota bacterium]
MKLLTLFVLALAMLAVGCWSSESHRYMISESKAYEASLFRQNCAICHGPEGEGKTLDDGKQIPNLRDGEFKYKTDAEIYRHIADGGNGMTPFRGQLTDREINLMVRFVREELRSQKGKR